ncbi:MAG: hypothetical protein MUF52_15555, partial [Syntrophobacteraceae bacterium]|nr:hypothetical protein [Syntrophobacteraceae bacterium]
RDLPLLRPGEEGVSSDRTEKSILFCGAPVNAPAPSTHRPGPLHGSPPLLIGSVLPWDLFPDCYVEGSGLTSFKVAREYPYPLSTPTFPPWSASIQVHDASLQKG